MWPKKNLSPFLVLSTKFQPIGVAEEGLGKHPLTEGKTGLGNSEIPRLQILQNSNQIIVIPFLDCLSPIYCLPNVCTKPSQLSSKIAMLSCMIKVIIQHIWKVTGASSFEKDTYLHVLMLIWHGPQLPMGMECPETLHLQRWWHQSHFYRHPGSWLSPNAPLCALQTLL